MVWSLSVIPVAVPAQAASEREAERVGCVQWEEQRAVWVADTNGEQGLTERRHQHWGDDWETQEGEINTQSQHICFLWNQEIDK